MSKLPSLYLNSKLFHRPCRDVKETPESEKALNVPDTQLEDLEPEEGELKVNNTDKAISLLKTSSTHLADKLHEEGRKFKEQYVKETGHDHHINSIGASNWLADRGMVHENNDHHQAFAAGWNGHDKLPEVTGWRHGEIPKSGQSYNYRENHPESGVSLAALSGGEQTHASKITTTFERAAGRKKVRVKGRLLPHTGSDGEPLVIFPEKIHKAEPDTTGSLEGKFKVSLTEMLHQLNKIISAEYSQWMRYYHYSLVLRGYYRNALADEFESHAKEELRHAEALAMRVIGLGGYPTTDMIPPEPLRDTEEILKELLLREQKGMKLYRDVHDLCGDNEGTRQVLEDNMRMEQEHIDDLWRFLKHPDLIKAGSAVESAGRETIISDKQSRRAYDNSFNRQTIGISGGETPDLPERGKDWHNEKEEEEAEKEAKVKWPNPINLVDPEANKENKMGKSLSFLDEYHNVQDFAIKALAGAPRFTPGPIVPPKEKEFLLAHGYSEEDFNNKVLDIPPRLRAQFNKWMTATVQKSISRLSER